MSANDTRTAGGQEAGRPRVTGAGKGGLQDRIGIGRSGLAGIRGMRFRGMWVRLAECLRNPGRFRPFCTVSQAFTNEQETSPSKNNETEITYVRKTDLINTDNPDP